MIPAPYVIPNAYVENELYSVIRKNFSLENTILLLSPSVERYLPVLLQGYPFYTIPEVSENSLRLYFENSLFKRENHVIALGGGKVLDFAKLAHRTNLNECTHDEWIQKEKIQPVESETLLAIPTTPATGSEISRVAVFMGKNSKMPIFQKNFCPDMMGYFPGLLNYLPREKLIHSLFDSLSHALEGWLSPLATSFLKEIAQTYAAKILNNLETLLEQKSMKLNPLSVFVDGTMAGFVQSYTSVGLTHSLAHAFEFLHPQENHGKLIMNLMSLVFSFNAEKTPKVELLFKALNYPFGKFKNLLKEARNKYGVCNVLVEPNEDNINLVFRDPCTRTNCRLVRKENVADILKRYNESVSNK